MNSLLRSVRIVFGKELMDGLRDRRSVLSAFLLPIMAPLMITGVFKATADRARQAESIQIPVVGAEHAPALMDWLQQQHGVEIVEGPEDPEAAVRERERALVLVIPKDFAERFSKARSAEVELVIDSSRPEIRRVIRRVRGLVNRYGQQIATLRLIARGVSPEVARPVAVEDIEVSSAQRRAAILLSFIPMFAVIAAFAVGMQVATDSTAGERERGSLEPLLVNPVPRRAIVVGKWLAAVVFSAVCVLLTLGFCALALQRVPLADLGLRFQLGSAEAIGVLAATLPMAFLASGSQVLVATFARSFKEAQSYLGLLMFVPVIPAVMSSLYPLGKQAWMIPLPILGQHMLLTEVLGGETPPLGWFAVAGLSALVGGLLCVAYTTRLFRREKIIFGR